MIHHERHGSRESEVKRLARVVATVGLGQGMKGLFPAFAGRRRFPRAGVLGHMWRLGATQGKRSSP